MLSLCKAEMFKEKKKLLPCLTHILLTWLSEISLVEETKGQHAG